MDSAIVHLEQSVSAVFYYFLLVHPDYHLKFFINTGLDQINVKCEVLFFYV